MVSKAARQWAKMLSDHRPPPLRLQVLLAARAWLEAEEDRDFNQGELALVVAIEGWLLGRGWLPPDPPPPSPPAGEQLLLPLHPPRLEDPDHGPRCPPPLSAARLPRATPTRRSTVRGPRRLEWAV